MAKYAISSLKIGDDTYVNTLPYGICSTAASTKTKEVDAGAFALEKGASINVKFSYTNTATEPTFKVKNTSVAKPIYYKGTPVPANYLKANQTYTFVFNGSQWDLTGYSNIETSASRHSLYYTIMCDIKNAYSDNDTVANGLVIIPYTTTAIKNDAYKESAMCIVVIPDSVTSIGDRAFYNCDSLTSVEIPDSVTTIGNSAFSSCYSLTSVIIPDSVTSLGEHVFDGCDNLVSVVIGDGVTSIGYQAFYQCVRLKSVVLGDSVTTIGNRAFELCRNCESIIIPRSVTSIGSQAFQNCNSLASVYYKGTSDDWNKLSKNISSTENQKLFAATRYYYSETEPTTAGNFWHYVNGRPEPW